MRAPPKGLPTRPAPFNIGEFTVFLLFLPHKYQVTARYCLYNHTKIWVCHPFVWLFDCLFRIYSLDFPPIWTTLHTDNLWGPERNVAKMEFENSNPSPWKSGNSLRAVVFGQGEWFFACKINSVIPMHAKNEQIWPHGFRDKHIATGTATSSDWGSVVTNLTWVNDVTQTSLREWRRARRQSCAQQNGLWVLSMANFEFLKSDHN